MSERINYPDKVCPVHVGVPLRRVGPLYYCPVATLADEAEYARQAAARRAAELTKRLRWVADVTDVRDAREGAAGG